MKLRRAFHGPWARVAIPAAVAGALGAPAQGAEWERSAGVSAGAIYSDNVCLRQQDEEDETIGTLTPNIRLGATGARARMDLYAAAQFNTLDDSDVECSVGGADNISPAPRVRFNGNAELLPNWFYLDATAFADQNRINPFATGGEDTLDGRGNLNTSYQYAVSPYISRRLTRTASMLLRYSYSEEYNSEEELNDNQVQAVQFDIGTSPELARLSYGLSGNYSEIDYDEREGEGNENLFNSELSSAQVRAAFQMTRTWQVNGYAGEEWNDYVTVFEDAEGSFWDLGLAWTPSERVTVEAGYGERFFGDAPRASIAYRHKRSTLRASYVRELTYNRTLRGTDPFAEDIDDVVDDNIPGQDEVIGPDGVETTLTNSPILNEQFLLVYQFTGRRTSFAINASRSEQTRMEDGFEDLFTYAGISADRQLGRRLSAFGRVSWSRREPDEARSTLATRDSDVMRYTLGVERGIGHHTSVSLSYQYSDRRSDIPQDEYEENRVILQFRYQL